MPGVGEAAKNKFGTLNQRKVLKISGQKKATDLKVLLTAAPKDLVKSYINIFHRAKLNLLTLDTAAFALIRSLVGNDPSALLMVDVGAVVTNIMVVVGGIPVLNRSTQVGGLTVTKAIASQLNISLDQAEQFKYDVGLGLNQTADPVPKIVETILTPLVDELKYTLANYQSQGRRPIEKVILTGVVREIEYGLESQKIRIGEVQVTTQRYPEYAYGDQLKIEGMLKKIPDDRQGYFSKEDIFALMLDAPTRLLKAHLNLIIANSIHIPLILYSTIMLVDNGVYGKMFVQEFTD